LNAKRGVLRQKEQKKNNEKKKKKRKKRAKNTLTRVINTSDECGNGPFFPYNKRSKKQKR
jgi:hypothetical protein